MNDSELGRSLRDQIDARLEQADLMPDPDDMFRRAAKLDSGRVDALGDAEVLRPFVEAYRDRLDGRVRALDAGRPPARMRSPSAVPWIVAAAAVVLVVVGVASSMGSWRQAMLESLSGGGNEAQHGSNAERSVEEATNMAPASQRSPSTPRSSMPDDSVVPDAVVVPEEPEPEPESEPEPVVDAPAPSLAERLESLDASAQAAWRRGDLKKAERGYRTIVRLGGRREAAEMAYGELFALVRQRGGDLPALWRAYLRKFPRGRYAEDVAAGLCRRTPAAERDACWTRYRTRFPNGIHAP